MKIIYMGTPEFAVPPLLALIEKHEVLAVVTQPDRPKGRGNKMMFTPPVKETALKHGIQVLQPERAKRKSFYEELLQFNFDIIVVAAYGQILPESILKMARFGAINIHGSLLPKYRGAAPIQQAIIDGEEITGITIIQMDKGIDTGDMLLKRQIMIEDDDTYGTLHDKLSILGAGAVLSALEDIENGTAIPQKQDNAQSSYTAMLNKEMGQIDWTLETKKIACLIRGLNPWPCAYTFMENGEMLKIWKAIPYETENIQTPGTIIAGDQKTGIIVATKDSALRLLEVQGVGGKRMKADDYIRGHNIKSGFRSCTKNIVI